MKLLQKTVASVLFIAAAIGFSGISFGEGTKAASGGPVVDKITYSENYYGEPSAAYKNYTTITIDRDEKVAYCGTKIFKDKKRFVKQTTIKGDEYKALMALLAGPPITEKDQPSYNSDHTPPHSDIYLIVYKGDEYQQLQWYDHHDNTLDKTNRGIALAALVKKLSDESVAAIPEGIQTYDLAWKKIVIDRRLIVFGGLKWSKTATVLIDAAKETLTCTYKVIDKDKKLDKTKTFGKTTYDELMALLAATKLQDTKYDPDLPKIAWDAGQLNTISFFTEGPMAYGEYIDGGPYPQSFVITGKKKEVVAFIDELAAETEK